MHFYGIFQTDVLIVFFISLNRAEAITWENLVPAKRDLGIKKGISRLVRMKLFACNRRI